MLHSPSPGTVTNDSREQWTNEEGENTVEIIVRELDTKEVACDAMVPG